MPKKGFSRIEVADRKVIHDSDKFIKEALIGNTLDPDRMREIGGLALQSGLGGAFFGLPGIIGGLGGGIATGIAEDFMYNTKSNVQKASWQTGIAMEKINQVAINLRRELGQKGQILAKLGEDLKNFVDAQIEKKKDVKVGEDNILLALTQQNLMEQLQAQQQNMQNNAQGTYLGNQQTFAKNKFKKNKRFASEKLKAIGEGGGYMGIDAVGDAALKGALNVAEKAAKPTNLLKGLGTFGLGIIGQMGAGELLNAIENTKSAQVQLNLLKSDLNKIFTEVQRLLQGNPELGNYNALVSTLYQFIDRLIADLNQQSQEATQVAQQNQQNQQYQGT